jgi:hypothetical protein
MPRLTKRTSGVIQRVRRAVAVRCGRCSSKVGGLVRMDLAYGRAMANRLGSRACAAR